MKKYTYTLLFFAPICLWAQSGATSIEDIDLSDVIKVNEPAIDGVSVDSAESEIPEVTTALPGETEIVLELPGQGATDVGTASVGAEETISVDFPDEDVRTILRNVADLFDLNLVIPDTLQGRTSLKLSNITWRQVFEIVLEQQGFTYIEDRNIIRIKSIEEITTEPVDTRVFIVSFAQASDLESSIKPLVDTAAGGRIQVDTRSNALVITERPSRMNKIQEIIESLDKATDQVMIESKFVEIRRTDAKDLGVDWSSLGGENGGVNLSVSDAVSAANGGGTNFVLEEAQDALGFPTTSSSSARNLSTNPLDSAVFSSTSFGAVLKALETQNDVELVSNPTVVTMNNEKAEIKISREFPQPDFTFNAETGQRQFNGLGEPIDVGITLEVTPSVNAAGFINLDIFPEVSSTSEDRVIEDTAFPIRDVRTARTRIMIKDGYTLALGGLVSSEKTEAANSVPILGSLPGIGRLFSSESEELQETNLIIFITAKTLNPDGTDYQDTIDPRLLDNMGITPSKVPGYELSDEQSQQLEELTRLRQFKEDTEAAKLKAAQAEAVSAAIQALEKAEEYEEEQDEEPRSLDRL